MQNKAVSPIFEIRRQSAGLIKWLMKTDFASRKEFLINRAVWLAMFALIIMLMNVAGIGTARANQEQDTVTTTVEKPVSCTVRGEGAEGKVLVYDVHLLADPSRWSIENIDYVGQKFMVAAQSDEVKKIPHVDEDFKAHRAVISCAAEGGQTISFVISEGKPAEVQAIDHAPSKAAVKSAIEKPMQCMVTAAEDKRIIPLIGPYKKTSGIITVMADPERWKVTDINYVLEQVTSGKWNNTGFEIPQRVIRVTYVCPLDVANLTIELEGFRK